MKKAYASQEIFCPDKNTDFLHFKGEFAISIPIVYCQLPIALGFLVLKVCITFNQMIDNEIRRRLQDIVSGTLLEEQGDHCTTIRNHLCQSFGSGPTLKSEFESRAKLKKEQAEFLKSYAQNSGIWLSSIPPDNKYLTRGGESRIYLNVESNLITKINDGVYYATWTEYFNSLVIHNLLFTGTKYTLLGFLFDEHSSLCAVLTQPFIQGGQTSLKAIKELLTYNEFVNLKRQDYYNDEFGLLLEDMHDENVIAKDNVLFFIDTVFYILKCKK